MSVMRIVRVEDERKLLYRELLLLGDEEMSMVEKYLWRGVMFALYDDDLKAVAVVTDEGSGVLEIKNISVVPEFQRMGYGSSLISYIMEYAEGHAHHTVLVGTGDTPHTINFYEKNGFRYSHTVRNFFTDNYSAPVYDEGQLLKDMIYFQA